MDFLIWTRMTPGQALLAALLRYLPTKDPTLGAILQTLGYHRALTRSET